LKVFAIGAKETVEQASSWSSLHQLTYIVIPDANGDIYTKYGMGSVPYHVIIDRRFKIRHSQEKFEKELSVGIIQDTLLEKVA